MTLLVLPAPMPLTNRCATQALSTFVVAMLIIVGVVIWLEQTDSKQGPAKAATQQGSTLADGRDGLADTSVASSTNSTASLILGSFRASAMPTGPPRVYTSGLRLEELLGWTSVEVCKCTHPIVSLETDSQTFPSCGCVENLRTRLTFRCGHALSRHPRRCMHTSSKWRVR